MAARLFFIPKTIPLNTTGGLMSGAKANFYITDTVTRQNTFTLPDLLTPHANPVVADGNGVFAAIYLDDSLNYKIDLTDSADVQLAGYPINDLAAGTIAADVTVADAGTYFADGEVEAVLQDIGGNYLKSTRSDTINATYTWEGGVVALADFSINRPALQDYSIFHGAAASSGGTVTYDAVSGNSWATTLTENTTAVLSNPSPTDRYCQLTIEITQDGAGGAYTMTWPAAVVWAGGTAPVISTGNDAVDIITLHTRDNGTIWYGDFSQAYA